MISKKIRVKLMTYTCIVLLATILTTAMTIPFGKERTVNAASITFTDVSENHWAFKDIHHMAQRGIVAGNGDGTFGINNNVTRGQFAAFLARTFKLESGESSFPDVPKDHMFYKEISQVAKAGIVKGSTDGYFYPTQEITRQDIAVMLSRILSANERYNKTTLNFHDKRQIAPYALESVKNITAYRITSGTGNNMFEPYKSATRAEAIRFIVNLETIVNGGTIDSNNNNNNDTTHYLIPNSKHPDKGLSYEQLLEKYGPQKTYTFFADYDAQLYNPIFDKVVEEDILQTYMKSLQIPNGSTPIMEGFMRGHLINHRNLMMHEYPHTEMFSASNYAFLEHPLVQQEMKKGTFMPHLTKVPYYTINIELGLIDFQRDIAPQRPEKNGVTLIDMRTFSRHAAIYDNKEIRVMESKKPAHYKQDGILRAEANTLFEEFGDIHVQGNSLTIRVGENTLVVEGNSSNAVLNNSPFSLSQKVERENDHFYVPLIEVAEKLGLHTRTLEDFKRIEISNDVLRPNFTIPHRQFDIYS